MNAVLKITSLYKSFEDVKALNGVSLSINKGEMFGLVGPDGAGKTTLIRIACGLISANEGLIEIFGKNVSDHKKEIQNKIGYLSQKFSLYGDLSIDENIEFFADIHGVVNFKARRDELLNFTRLTSFRKRTADKLSGGMKQKLALACSLIHRPEFLFLDEPTTGVDPLSRRDFWKILSGLLKDGITILMTTPYLDEAERCSRVALIDKGNIISIDSPNLLKASINKNVLEISCSPVRKAYNILKEHNYEVQIFGDRVNLIIDAEYNDSGSIKKLLIDNDVKVTGERNIIPSLENIFIHLVKNQG
jgi:ABC-2 type transport system ATP-binding protein